MINLASKYSKKIVEAFTKNSYIAGNTTDEYDFVGVRSINVYSPQTVPLNDYTRSGDQRYGTPVEMQDEVQEMVMTQDKGFSITIDKGNNLDQMNIKGAARMLSLQIKEQVTPFVDKYAFERYVNLSGQKAGLAAAPTNGDIVEKILAGGAALDNALVPDESRVVYVPVTYYNLLRQNEQFSNFERVGTKGIVKGEVGAIGNMRVIKVPDTYLPEGVYFLITYTRSVLLPFKIKDTKIHQDPPGISGNLLEGRHYFDAFVLGRRADGVYAAVKSDSLQAAPSIAITSGKATVTSTGASAIYYTLDGTDPRYSKSRAQYSAAVTMAEGQTIKAYAEASGSFPSNVASATNQG